MLHFKFLFYLCKVNCPSDRKYWDRKYLYYDILEHIKFCLVGQYDRLILFSMIIQNYVQNILLYNKNKEHVRIPWVEWPCHSMTEKIYVKINNYHIIYNI